MASSSINIRVSEEWARTPRSERQYISEIAAQDYVAQASWRGAADPGSAVSNYPHLTPPYRPPTSQLLPPESRTSQVAYNQPEMYTHPPSYAHDARFIHLNASSQPLVENPGHDTRYSYSSVPAYPTNSYPHVINPPPFAIESNTSPPARHATSTITIEPAPRDDERRQQVYVQSPIPVPFTPPAPNASVDFEQILRSYEHVLGSLPAPDAWVDDQARRGYSAAALEGLLSSAVAGLQTLDPTARFVPCETEPHHADNDISPPRSSNANPPAVRSKRRRAIQKCLSCDSTSTPEWRKGPMGPRTLCNACGLVWAKVLRKRALEERGRENPSKPTTKVSSSSHSHNNNQSSPLRGSQHSTKPEPS